MTEFKSVLVPADHDYVPRESWSPSGLTTAQSCQRKYAWRYIAGLREREYTFADIDATYRPIGAVESRNYSRLRSRALGTAVHAVLEAHYRGSAVDWSTEPGRIAQSGLLLLPEPSPDCVVEQEISLTSPGDDPIHFTGRCDLYADGVLYDFKTTSDLRYAKTPEELRADPQVALYAAHWLPYVPAGNLLCKWVYLRTRGSAKSAVSQVAVTVNEVETQVATLTAQALDLREKMRLKLAPEEYPANLEHCTEYGGCVYSAELGGPCRRGMTLLNRFKINVPIGTEKQVKEANMTLRFGDLKSNAIGKRGDNESLQGELSRDTEAPSALAVLADPELAVEKHRRGRPPRATNRETKYEPLTIEVVAETGDAERRIPVAEGSPLYDRLRKLIEAHY